MPSKTDNVSPELRVVILPDHSTYTPYCAELQRRPVIITCKGVGIPELIVNIYGNNTFGNLSITEIYQVPDEIHIRIDPTSFRDVVMLHCQGSTTMMKVDIMVNLTYSCMYMLP